MPSAHPSLGFQAVILCGPGLSLSPFTDSVDLPKALIPIANKPMVHYPLEWCEKAGFDSILVLTLTEHLTAIQSYIRHRSKTASIQVEAASSLEDNYGTADVLRVAYQKGWLTSDFAVLPCDLVTNMEPTKIAELWMVTQAGFDGDLGRRSRTARHADASEDGRRGPLGVWYEAMGEGAVKGQETDFLAVAPNAKSSVVGGSGLPEGYVGTLLNTFPTQALKSTELTVRRGMVLKHPDLKLFMTCRDSGLYFFPYWVLKFIDKNPRLNSIREDVLPWIAKARWQHHRLAEKLGLPEILGGGVDSDTASDDAAMVEYDVSSMSSSRRSKSAAASTSEEQRVTIPGITAYLPSSSPSLFVRRIDTPHLYLFSCLHLAKTDPTAASMVKIDPSAYIGEKAIVTAMDCIVGDKVSIGERAVVKKSVLGSGVSLGRGVRLTGCVLMDGASVAENAKLESCIISRKAVIGSKAVLKDCEVAEGYVVDEGTEAKNERFVAGLEADSDDLEDEDEDEDDASGAASDGDDDDEAAFSDEDD